MADAYLVAFNVRVIAISYNNNYYFYSYTMPEIYSHFIVPLTVYVDTMLNVSY